MILSGFIRDLSWLYDGFVLCGFCVVSHSLLSVWIWRFRGVLALPEPYKALKASDFGASPKPPNPPSFRNRRWIMVKAEDCLSALFFYGCLSMTGSPKYCRLHNVRLTIRFHSKEILLTLGGRYRIHLLYCWPCHLWQLFP